MPHPLSTIADALFLNPLGINPHDSKIISEIEHLITNMGICVEIASRA